MENQKYSPMIEHYLATKARHPEALLFYRLGDFYEMFFDDAKTASSELDLVLTSKAAGSNQKVPMCGIPYHAVNSYISRLIKKGYKVSICEQLSDPATFKGLVDRDIIRIVTPGTYMEEGLDSDSYNYLAAIGVNAYQICILYCELSTGTLKEQMLERNIVSLQKALLSYGIKEVVILSSFDKKWKALLEEAGFILSEGRRCRLEKEDERLLRKENDLSRQTLAMLMDYLQNTQMQSIDHLMPIEAMNDQNYLQMDYESKQHLELLQSSSSNPKASSLFSTLNKTKSAIGSRMLKEWIERPLMNLDDILKRQKSIIRLFDGYMLRLELQEDLSHIYDMERLVSRIAYGNASARDILQLVSSLAHAKPILENLKKLEEWPELSLVNDCQSLYLDIKDAIVEDPPLTLKEGGFFQKGYNVELDRLREISDKGQNYILELEAKERERTGIKNLKIGYNRVFGYYIDVRNTQLSNIKEEFGYKPRQTLANSTRFITDELKSREEEILEANQKKNALESELFKALLSRIKQDLFDLHALSKSLAAADVLAALAQVAYEQNYCIPSFNTDHHIEVLEGRHPVLEQKMSGFISNDWKMDSNINVELITGPNMGGKSTFMRQNALLVIMAQMGSLIPARKANLPIFDRIFTRIGASDDLLQGQSTFMVEMLEANHALHYASKNSLILFDEIGRGTATYDGMALAQAMMEYIDKAIGAKTLFSTHYHELTEMENHSDSIKNIHVDVKEKKNDIRFLYRMIPGKADKSYGINVAKLAGLPEAVIKRADSLLEDLEKESAKKVYEPSLFIMDEANPKKSLLIDRLEAMDVDSMSPREALDCLYELKQLQQDAKEDF